MTKKNKHKQKSISTRIRRFVTKLTPMLIIGIVVFLVLIFVHPIVGLVSIPVISIVSYRYMAGGFKWPKGGNKNFPPNSHPPSNPNPINPNNNMRKTEGSPPPKASQQTTNTSQVVKINLYGLDGHLINTEGPNGGPESKQPQKPAKKVDPKPPPRTTNTPPPAKPVEVLQAWESTLDAFIANNRHKFLNSMGTVIEQAIRYASLREFGQILPTGEAIPALVKKNYFHYPRNHLLWLWQCRNDYAHESRVMKTEVDQLSDEVLLQIFEISKDIVSSCIHNI